jgi:DNA invertase Pin-like site-specific DNA recombinase
MSRSAISRRAKQTAEVSKPSSRGKIGRDVVPLHDVGNAWDEFSVFCAGPDAELVAPPPPKPSLMRVAVYARYSTDAQKESSIHRQVKNCAAYYTTLGVRHHRLFSDEGVSASTSVQREALQELLKQCDEGKFDAIVVEDFDRWSRDLLDSLEIAQRLDAARVQLHCAAVRRRLSFEDVVNLAMAAQHDKERRRNLCMAGLDQMVGNDHGMPWGKCFGYVESGVPGHPNKHPEQARAVHRAFELGLKVSAADAARILGEEGHLSLNGTLLWSAGMVAAIWACTTYAALVRYRKRAHERDRKTGKVVSKSRPAHEMKQAYNENFEIVSKELFKAVQEAKRGRTRGEGTAGCAKQQGPVMLFGAATCDCKGAVGQRFYANNSRYHCSLDRDRHACLSKTTKGFPIELVDRAILAILREALAPRMSDIKLKEEFESTSAKRLWSSTAGGCRSNSSSKKRMPTPINYWTRTSSAGHRRNASSRGG